jgi:DNA-binding response OmpR family regulator
VNAVRLDEARLLSEGDELQIAVSVSLKFIGAEATVPLSLEEPVGAIQGITLDARTREVKIKGRVLEPPLSLYQYRLLELLCSSPGAVCTRDEVVRAVWPDAVEEGISEQAIDALVRRLRDRLTELSPDHEFIATVRGHGFRLIQPGPESP